MSYYKYQDVKTIKEYEEEYLNNRNNLNEYNINEIRDIPIFRDCVFNLNRLSQEISSFEELYLN